MVRVIHTRYRRGWSQRPLRNWIQPYGYIWGRREGKKTERGREDGKEEERARKGRRKVRRGIRRRVRRGRRRGTRHILNVFPYSTMSCPIHGIASHTPLQLASLAPLVRVANRSTPLSHQRTVRKISTQSRRWWSHRSRTAQQSPVTLLNIIIGL